jgi:nucleotide-binding universal stress UspA family protein
MFTTIVVGVQESDRAKDAGYQAAELAQMTGADLHLVTAVKGDGAMVASADSKEGDRLRSVMEGIATSFADRSRIHTHALPGHPAQVILQVAGEVGADLIVVGNKGADRKVLSSVPQSVVTGAPCSVLVLKTA